MKNLDPSVPVAVPSGTSIHAVYLAGLAMKTKGEKPKEPSSASISGCEVGFLRPPRSPFL